jgi:hypothetical protein
MNSIPLPYFATALCATCGLVSYGFGVDLEAAQLDADSAFFIHAQQHHGLSNIED